MSAIAAHFPPAPADRRYQDIAHYDPATFFHYSQPSLEGSYALNSSAAAASYWDTHDAPPYQTSSAASLPANTYGSSPSSSAHAGPSLPAYPSDYSHRSLSRSTAYPAASASAAASAVSSSSSRSAYPSSARAYSSLADAAGSPNSSAHPRLQNAQWDNSSLYTIDPSADAPSPPQSSLCSTPPIKEEDAESSFVIEVSVPAEQPTASPMPEVPLRATHAPPKMRRMMYSFRLENFAMHDGIRSAATQPGSGGIEVGPLRESPVELEWQVDLDAPLVPQEPDAAGFRYAALPSPSHNPNHHAHGHSQSRPARSHDYRDRAVSPPSSGTRHTRAAVSYQSHAHGSPSPSLSVDYSSAVENDSWDASSAYGSVGESASASGGSSGMTASPTSTFTSVMTPAQSLGAWGMRYADVQVDGDAPGAAYRRPAVQSSLSRVSQAHGGYVFAGPSPGSSKSAAAYQQSHPQSQSSQSSQSQYASAYDSAGYSTRAAGSASRYASDVYGSSSSTGAAQAGGAGGSSASWYTGRSS